MEMNFVREYFERRKIRKRFSKYLSKDFLKQLEKDPPPYARKPEPKSFQFVILQIDESDPQDFSALLQKIMETCFRHGAYVSTVHMSLFVAHLGPPSDQNNNPESRRILVDDIVRENPNRVRVVHGECTGLIGVFGCELRSVWGPLIPNFSDILRKLLDAPMGTVIEISEEQSSSAEHAKSGG
jgi:predicted TIM-barrel fold metal-dependent hydrolase